MQRKVYNMGLRPAIMCGVEKVEQTKKQEVEKKVAELRMLKLSLGVTRMEKRLEKQGRDGLDTCTGETVDSGAARQEEKRKTVEKLHGCGEERHAEHCCDR